MINSPLDYSGCVIWLDGSSSTYFKQLSTGSGDVSNNDPVGYWQNLGSLGSVGHFTNIGGSTTTRPTYISSLSCLRFDGVNDYLTLSATQTYTALTLFVVVAPTVFGAGNRIYVHATQGLTDAASYMPIYQNQANNTVGSFVNPNIVSVVNFRSNTAFDIITHSHSGTSVTNFANGAAGTPWATNLGTLTVHRSRIGAGINSDGSAANFHSKDISEVIVYSRALTDFERADVEYYLTRKWSVLNSIPRQVYAIRNGVWSNTNTWSVSGYGTPWGLPVSTDDVYSNSFTVTADQNAFVQSLRTAALSPNIAAGGTFAITQPNITITASPSGFLAGTTTCVTGLLSSGTSVLSGNIISDSTNPTTAVINVINQSNGNLTIYGNIRSLGGRDRSGIRNEGSGTITIYGNLSSSNFSGGAVEAVRNNSTGNITVFGNVQSFGVNDQGGGSHGILNNSVGNVYVTGDIFGPDKTSTVNNNGIRNNSVGTVVVNGNLYAGNTIGSSVVFQNSTGTLIANGNIYASSNGHGVVSSNTAARNEITGALFNSDNGRQAVYAARYLLKPKVFESYTYNKNTELVNLLTYSEQFDNAAWTKTATTVTANVSANPSNNQFTGDRLVETATTNAHLTNRSFSTAISGLSSSTDTTFRPLDLVFSVYARQATNDRRYMVLALDSGTTAGATTPTGLSAVSVIYDLQTGTMTGLSATGTARLTLSSMESVGNGWYRCMIEGRIHQSATPWNVFPTIAISDRADYSGTRATPHYPSYAGNALSGIAIWGAQFEYNSLTPYVSSEFYQGFANRSAQPVFFYAPEAYALSYVPHVSSVKLGTTYAAVSTLSGVNVNITEQLSGTMIVPSPQVVSYNVPVDDTVGTALHNAEDAWNVTLSSLTADNSIGTRIANSATFTEVGSALQTLRF